MTTLDHALVEAIRQVAQIPTERRLWSVRTIAAFADLSESHVAQKIVNREDFPRPSKIDGVGHPRWPAGEVMAWFEAHRVSPQAPKP